MGKSTMEFLPLIGAGAQLLTIVVALVGLRFSVGGLREDVAELKKDFKDFSGEIREKLHEVSERVAALETVRSLLGPKHTQHG